MYRSVVLANKVKDSVSSIVYFAPGTNVNDLHFWFETLGEPEVY